MSLWITGTGSEVGKTTVCALLAWRYGRARPLHYWKPVATGSAEESDPETLRTLAQGVLRILPSRYTYAPSVSPHLAGRMARAPIAWSPLQAAWRQHRSVCGPLVVEGAGGALVPFNDAGLLSADWFASLGLPALVVASSTLGTLSHTLLTLEALRRRHIAIAGVVLNGPAHEDNASALEAFGNVPVLGHLPPLAWCDAPALQDAAERFDPHSRLGPWLAHNHAPSTPPN